MDKYQLWLLPVSIQQRSQKKWRSRVSLHWIHRIAILYRFECKNLVCFIELYKKNKLKERRLFISVSWASVDCVFLSLLFLSCLVGPHSHMLIFLSSILTNTFLCFSRFSTPLACFCPDFVSCICPDFVSCIFLTLASSWNTLQYFQARFPSLHIFSSLLTCVCHRNAFFIFFLK